MKHFITTIILLAAAVVVTVVYFRSLNQPGKRPAEIMRFIPNDASLVLEFSNDDGFYEAFNNSTLFTSIMGPQKSAELLSLKKALLNEPALKAAFANQHIFISLYPDGADKLEFLITTSPNSKSDGSSLAKLTGNKARNFTLAKNKDVFKLTLPGLDRPFYVYENEDKIISAGFSAELVVKASAYNYKEHRDTFLQLSNQQDENALAVLYINYDQLQPLFKQLFVAKNAELLRPLRMLSAKAALSLNYKTTALMFNGLSEIKSSSPSSYLNLFTSQQPVASHLKEILPATTAYSCSFGVANPAKYIKDLNAWQNKSGISAAKKQLFNEIKSQTGVNFEPDFNKSLGNEFAVVTTRFQEKIAIIQLSESQQLAPSLANISTMQTGSIGQFNYTKLPFYLLGDAFSIFNKPYFMVINNYLVLANTPAELRSYNESYDSQKFLNKTTDFNEFDQLVAERSNVSFFVNFKNLKPVLGRDLAPGFFTSFSNNSPGFKDFYGASFQLSAADKNFYTNFCLKLSKPAASQ